MPLHPFSRSPPPPMACLDPTEPDQLKPGGAADDLLSTAGSVFREAHIHVTEISLENTLLLDAVQKVGGGEGGLCHLVT